MNVHLVFHFNPRLSNNFTNVLISIKLGTFFKYMFLFLYKFIRIIEELHFDPLLQYSEISFLLLLSERFYHRFNLLLFFTTYRTCSSNSLSNKLSSQIFLCMMASFSKQFIMFRHNFSSKCLAYSH